MIMSQVMLCFRHCTVSCPSLWLLAWFVGLSSSRKQWRNSGRHTLKPLLMFHLWNTGTRLVMLLIAACWVLILLTMSSIYVDLLTTTYIVVVNLLVSLMEFPEKGDLWVIVWFLHEFCCYFKKRVILIQNYSVLKITTMNNSYCPSYASYLAKSATFTRTVHFKQGMWSNQTILPVTSSKVYQF